jgi:hypothetical protein
VEPRAGGRKYPGDSSLGPTPAKPSKPRKGGRNFQRPTLNLETFKVESWTLNVKSQTLNKEMGVDGFWRRGWGQALGSTVAEVLSR